MSVVLHLGRQVPRYLWLVSEISVSEDSRGDDGPQVEDPAEPGRDDLDPDGRRVGGEGTDVGARAERVESCGSFSMANIQKRI